jgi:hypothetical protein
MLELRGNPSFTLKALDEPGVDQAAPREHLECYLAAELAIPRAVDNGHTTAPKLFQHVVLGGQGGSHSVELGFR